MILLNAAAAVAAVAARISQAGAARDADKPLPTHTSRPPPMPFAAARPIPPGHPHLGRIPNGGLARVPAVAHDAASPGLARSTACFQAASVVCPLCRARFLPPPSFAGKSPYCRHCHAVITANAKSGDGFIAPKHPSLPWNPPS